MEAQRREKVMALVIWLLLVFATLSFFSMGHTTVGIVLLGFVLAMAISILRMPPKGFKATMQLANPKMDSLVHEWYLPFLARNWKLVLVLIVGSVVAGSYLFPVLIRGASGL